MKLSFKNTFAMRVMPDCLGNIVFELFVFTILPFSFPYLIRFAFFSTIRKTKLVIQSTRRNSLIMCCDV